MIVQRAVDRLQNQMAVDAQDLVQEFCAETVHHSHHHDQRCDAQHDADKGKAGDDGNERFLAAGAQIAQRDHPLEGRKGASLARRGLWLGGIA